MKSARILYLSFIYSYAMLHLMLARESLANSRVCVQPPKLQMKKAMSEAKDFFEPYQGERGWRSLMEQWMTMDLVDYYYNPEPFFEEITFTTNMPSSIYYREVDRCIEMCYEIIPRRAEKMVSRLKDALYEGSSEP